MTIGHWLVGGYGPDSDGRAAGISLAKTRPDGVLEVVGLAAALESPSWITVHGDHVYAALEAAGQVVSLRRTGTGLEVDGTASAGGSVTCALAVSHRRLLAANYGDGTVGVIGLNAAGAVTELLQALPNTGSGPHPDQENARAHAVFATDDHAIISLDLGTDQALIHRWGAEGLERVGEYRFPAGTGPRDIARHPSGRFVVVGELDGSVHLLDWADGVLSPVASLVVDGFEPRTHSASIVFSGDGRFGYTSLRRAGRIARVEFTADGLRSAGSVSAEGPWVRHLAVDGDLLHAANEETDELTTFRIGADGSLTPIGASPAPSPTYLAPLLEY